MVSGACTGVDGCFATWQWQAWSHGIWYSGHGAHTAQRGNHLGRTAQRQCQCEGAEGHSRNSRPDLEGRIQEGARLGDLRCDVGHQLGNALPGFRQRVHLHAGHGQLHKLLPRIEPRLGTGHHPLDGRWGDLSARGDHFVGRQCGHRPLHGRPTGLHHVQCLLHHSPRRYYYQERGRRSHAVWRDFQARRTERQSALHGAHGGGGKGERGRGRDPLQRRNCVGERGRRGCALHLDSHQLQQL